MTLTPEQKAAGWRWYEGGEPPVKDDETWIEWTPNLPGSGGRIKNGDFNWSGAFKRFFYRIIEADGADAEPARPTPFPASMADLVYDADGWSQTIIVDGKRPEWLRDDDFVLRFVGGSEITQANLSYLDVSFAIRVRRREPKRETVKGTLSCQGNYWLVSYDLIDGKPDLSTLKIAEDAL